MFALILIAAVVLLLTLLMADLGWSNVLSTSRNELVFTGRNRAYGAYFMRQEHHRVLILSTVAAFGATAVMLAVPRLFAHEAPAIVTKPVLTVDVVLDAILPPPEDKKPPASEQRTLPPPDNKPIDREPVAVDSTLAPPDTARAKDDPIKIPDDGPGTLNPDTAAKGPTGPGSGGTHTGPRSYAEQMPEYPGGNPAMHRFLLSEIRFDSDMLQGKRSAEVYIEFVIDGEGDVASARIAKGFSSELDGAVMRAIGRMPRWIPGRQGDQPVSVRFVQPVKFSVR